MAVWELTNDGALLREAYEKAPAELLVGLAAFRSLPLSDEEKLTLARRLQDTHPDNILGSVLAASLAAKQKDMPAFRANLLAMQQHSGFDLDISARALAKREALMSLGKSPSEARIIAYSKEMAMPTQEFTAVDKMVSGEIKRLVAEGGTDEALLLSGQMMALAQKVQQEPGRRGVGDLMALSLQASGLRGLPEDVEIGDTGRTPKQQLESLKSGRDGWIAAHIGGKAWHMEHLDEAGAELYFQIADQQGERQALKWAESYNGPAPKSEPTPK